MAGLIAYYFRIVTPITIFANLIVIPLIAVIIALGMGLLLVGNVFPVVVHAFAMCLKLMLNLMVAFIFLCVKVPRAYFLLEKMPLWTVFLYYSCLILSIWGIKLIVSRSCINKAFLTT